jgi:hypothetical protein
MKNKIALFRLLLIAFAFTTVFSSCSDDDDTTPPSISLNGDQFMTINLQQNFVDPGATAIDDEDGSVTVTTSGSVDNNQTGDYTLTYSATDAAGNTATETRVVTVVNQLSSSPWDGAYSCVITTAGQPDHPYNDNLTISENVNNGLAFGKFGDYSNANAKLNIVITGSNVTVPTQTIVCGLTPVPREFSGSGTVTGNGSAGSQLILIIDETVNSSTVNFTYTYTKQ